MKKLIIPKASLEANILTGALISALSTVSGLTNGTEYVAINVDSHASFTPVAPFISMDLSTVLPWVPDFEVLRTAYGQYSVNKTANDYLPTHVSTKTYHTNSVTGNNANSGVDDDHALLNVSTAVTKTDAELLNVIIKPDATRIIWGARGWAGLSPTKNVILNTFDGQPVFMVRCILPTWTLDSGNVYKTQGTTGTSANSGSCIDLKARAQSMGVDPLVYHTSVASRAAVVAGSFYHDLNNTEGQGAGMIFLWPHDSRNLIGDLYMSIPATGGNISTNVLASETVNRTIHVSNVEMIGGIPITGTNLRTLDTSVRYTLVFNKCAYWGSLKNTNGLNIIGGYDIRCFDCQGGLNDRDTENIHGNTSGECYALFVRSKVTARTGYSATGTDNSNTGHENCRSISVMPQLANADGRVFAHVGTSKAQVFGGSIGPSNRVDAAGQSVQAGDTAQIDLYEVTLPPSAATHVLATDGGAYIRCHGMDISGVTKSGNVSSVAL